MNYKIVIDPGHGGMDIGASINNIYESDIVLEISFKIKEIFEEYGYFVILTRESKDALCDGKFIKKEDLNKRIDIINNSNASVFISVHLNKFNISKYSGAQVFYSLSNSNNYILANEIQYSLKKILGNTDRVTKGKHSNYILNRINIPGCLVECGFMSNNDELKLLLDEGYQYKIAKALLFGVNNYFKRN